MSKIVHDVVASEADFMRLCRRMDTQEDNVTNLELNLKLSLFSQGFERGMRESLRSLSSSELRHEKMFSDADWAAGYSAGSTMAESALSEYRSILEGK